MRWKNLDPHPAFRVSFCGTLRAYTLRGNHALLLAQPNLENQQETFENQGKNVVGLA